MRNFILNVAKTQLDDNAQATDSQGNALYTTKDYNPDSLQKSLDDISQSSLSEEEKWRESAALPSGIGNLTNAAVSVITATNAGALRMKLLQFASGAIYLDDKPVDDTAPTNTKAKNSASGSASHREFHEIHNLKLNAVVDILTKRDPVKEPCLLYTSPSPRDRQKSRMPSSA